MKKFIWKCYIGVLKKTIAVLGRIFLDNFVINNLASIQIPIDCAYS